MTRKRSNAASKAAPSYKTTWDLTLFYAHGDDPRILKDVAKAERACAKFRATYHGKPFTRTPASLARALAAYEAVLAMPEADRPVRYFMFRRELDATDSVAEKKLNTLSERLTKAGNQLLFFELELGRTTKRQQRILMRAPELAPHRYMLERIFLEAKHHLSEPEERILSLKSLPASSLWVAGTEKILNQETVRHKGHDVPLQEALSNVPKLPKTERRALWNRALDVCEQRADIAENELNAVVLNKKINDELRGYDKPYSATVLGNENSDTSVEALVSAVTDHFAISHRFYKLKARLMGERKLLYADKSASYGTRVTITFDEAVETLRDVFYSLHTEYGAILDRMLAQGQIDVYPQRGKSGGAFCAGGVHQPTMVLLNHVDDVRSLTTFAHEMGHAVHTERSKQQPTRYQEYSTATAETASTLFENLVFEAMLERLSEKQQLSALHDKLSDEMATIMRQIAFFNFERELHETIRRDGGMTKEEMAACMSRHLRAYLGPRVSVTDRDGYMFVYVPHFRMFFYVYTYAYGILISNVLSAQWKTQGKSIDAIDTFLTAGGSASPEAIFKQIGIDTADPAFFTRGLAALDAKVDRLEKLARIYA